MGWGVPISSSMGQAVAVYPLSPNPRFGHNWVAVAPTDTWTVSHSANPRVRRRISSPLDWSRRNRSGVWKMGLLAYFQHLQNSYQILRAFEANLFSAIDFSQLRDRARTEFSNKISSGVENRLSNSKEVLRYVVSQITRQNTSCPTQQSHPSGQRSPNINTTKRTLHGS